MTVKSQTYFLIPSLREKRPNTEFFLDRIFSHSDWIRRDPGKYGPEKNPYLDTFHAVHIYSMFFMIHVFQGPCFSKYRFFWVQVFEGTGFPTSRFSVSRFSRVQGLGPGFRSSRNNESECYIEEITKIKKRNICIPEKGDDTHDTIQVVDW